MAIATGTAMIVTAIIGTAVGIGSEIAGGVIDKNMAEDANRRSLDIWNQQKAADEKIRKENLNLAKLDRRFKQQELSFAKEKFKTEKETLGFQKRQQQMENTLGVINGSNQLRSTFVELFNRRKAA
jgi:hypothetical protein